MSLCPADTGVAFAPSVYPACPWTCPKLLDLAELRWFQQKKGERISMEKVIVKHKYDTGRAGECVQETAFFSPSEFSHLG